MYIVNRMCETYDTMNKENSVYSLGVIVQSIAIEFDKNKIWFSLYIDICKCN